MVVRLSARGEVIFEANWTYSKISPLPMSTAEKGGNMVHVCITVHILVVNPTQLGDEVRLEFDS